jgi:mRNA interferase MazF
MVRGELGWVDLGLPRGSAPALRRPILVISADQYNRSKLATVTMAVLTSNVQLAALPGNILVPADVLDELDVDSVINVTQIATIDRLGPSKGPGRRHEQPSSEEQVWKLIRCVRELASPLFAAWLQVATFTGLRSGELEALLDHSRILVVEQFNVKTRTLRRRRMASCARLR